MTIHFVDSTYQLKAYLLEIVEFLHAHTGVNNAEEIQEILKNWKLTQDKSTAVITDIPCFSHTLQLAVEVEVVLKLTEVLHALARCRHLVAHFNHPAKSSYLNKTD